MKSTFVILASDSQPCSHPISVDEPATSLTFFYNKTHVEMFNKNACTNASHLLEWVLLTKGPRLQLSSLTLGIHITKADVLLPLWPHPISFTFTSIALFVFNFRSQLKIKMMKYLWSACLPVSLPPLMFLNSLQNRLMCSNTGNSVILYRSPTDSMVLNFASAWCLHLNYFHLLVRSVLFFFSFSEV